MVAFAFAEVTRTLAPVASVALVKVMFPITGGGITTPPPPPPPPPPALPLVSFAGASPPPEQPHNCTAATTTAATVSDSAPFATRLEIHMVPYSSIPGVL